MNKKSVSSMLERKKKTPTQCEFENSTYMWNSICGDRYLYTAFPSLLYHLEKIVSTELELTQHHDTRRSTRHIKFAQPAQPPCQFFLSIVTLCSCLSALIKLHRLQHRRNESDNPQNPRFRTTCFSVEFTMRLPHVATPP